MKSTGKNSLSVEPGFFGYAYPTAEDDIAAYRCVDEDSNVFAPTDFLNKPNQPK